MPSKPMAPCPPPQAAAERALAKLFGLTPAECGALLHETHARPFLCNDDRTLFAGGDWALGARVECAFDSGTAIAEAIAAR